jgi:hypothetical protein
MSVIYYRGQFNGFWRTVGLPALANADNSGRKCDAIDIPPEISVTYYKIKRDGMPWHG